MKKIKYILSCMACLMLSVMVMAAPPKRAAAFDAVIQIVDEEGQPIPEAYILASAGAFSYYADADGKVSAKLYTNEINTVVAAGYEEASFSCTVNNIPEQVVLIKAAIRPDGRGSAAAVGSIDGSALEAFPELTITNTLQGRIAGLVVNLGASGLGNNTPTMYVRGLHGNSGNTPIVLIDGMERTLADIVAEEIDKIEVYKDALGKILYGPRGANGVISVTTKRGVVGRLISHASAEDGVNIGTRTPEYLNSYQYATLYNEACANDGLSPFYSDAQIEGYRNSAGANDLLYPDVDYYDYFTRNTSGYRKFNYNLAGGTQKLKYSMVFNYVNATGFEKVGKKSQLNRINLRGNIDAQVTDFLWIVGDMAARLETRAWGGLNQADAYAAMSSTRPNEFPLMIASDVLGLAPNEDGSPFFGASMQKNNNLLANLVYGGFNSERYITSQANIGLKFDFDKYVPGLKANAVLVYDNYSSIGAGQKDVYPVYAIRGTNLEDIEFAQLKKQSLQANQSLNSESLSQSLGFNSNISYDRSFGDHYLKADLAYRLFKDEAKGVAQDVKNDNLMLKLDYGYNQKLFLEGAVALMGSNKYVKGNRHFLSFSLGASWFVTENIKLKASAGRLGYDRSTSFLLYQTRWGNGSTVAFGEQNSGNTGHITTFKRVASELPWETDIEWNLGTEVSFLNGRLTGEANVFQEFRRNIQTGAGSTFGNIVGDFTGSAALGAVNNFGVDANIRWADRVGDFNYNLGMNFMFSKNKLVSWNEINYPDDNTEAVGKPTDVITGWNAIGLFGKDVDIASSPKQNLGEYGIGSIAYQDLNNDNQIDNRDMAPIGNSFPRAHLGLDISLNYKGFGFFAQGAAQLGFHAMRNNSYYWMKGQDKYSAVALERYHPVNNPDGWYPSLTTKSGNNNFLRSTYWLENASFFRLKNVELSYTFKFPNFAIKNLKIFARGTNLFVIAAEKNLDPETMNAGVTNYPLYRTITGGLSITL